MKNKIKKRMLSILLCFVILVGLMPITVSAAQQEISAVVATSSNLDTIPTLYGFLKIPTFNITQGVPAYITASDANLRWQKKIGGVWTNQDTGRFTPGEWRISTSLRLDNDGALQYDFAQNLTFEVNGKSWTVETPNNHGEYSFAWVYSPAFTIVDDPNVQPPIAVESVHMVLNGYTPGAAAASATVTTDANVTVEVLGFLVAIDSNGDGQPDASEQVMGNFASGEMYAVALQIKAKPGYDISGLTMENVSLDRALVLLLGQFDSEEDAFSGMFMLGDATQYTVNFETNGGSAIQSETVGGGTKLTKPADPTKAYYAFDGWYSDSNLTQAFDFNTPINADTTLYAKWTPSPVGGMFLMTIDLNGGTSTMPLTGEVPANTTMYFIDNLNGHVIPPSGKVLAGYEVDGVPYDPAVGHLVTQNFTLKLLWKDAPAPSPTLIDSVDVYINPPIIGSTLDYTTETTGTPPYTTGVRRWYKGGNVGVPGTQLDSNAIVEPDTTYILDFTVAPNDGYTLDNSTVVKLNGETAIKVSTLYGTNIAVYRVALTSPKIEIVNANAIITAPVAGENPSYNAISADPDKYDVTVDSWYLREGTFPTLNTTDTFEAGKSYAVRIKFTAKNGYTFIGATTYTINGLATTGYGEPSACQITFDIPANPPQHDFDTSEWGYKDSTGHAHVCQTPGCINHHDDINPHVESEWKYEASVHIKTCTECGYFIKREAHIDQNDDGYCDVCETVEYVTVEIPFIKVVKQTGDKTPGQKTFKFEIFDFGHSEAADHVEIIANTVSTSGKGEFDGILKLKLTKKGYLEENYLDEGFFVKETIETAEGWEYSTAVWYVSPNFSGVGWIYKVVENGNIVPDEKDEMIFTNSYNVKNEPIVEDEKEPEKEPDKKPENQSPQTGDTTPFAVINFVLFGGLMLIYFRKKLFIK